MNLEYYSLVMTQTVHEFSSVSELTKYLKSNGVEFIHYYNNELQHKKLSLTASNIKTGIEDSGSARVFGYINVQIFQQDGETIEFAVERKYIQIRRG